MKLVLIAPGWQAGKRTQKVEAPRGAYAEQAPESAGAASADALLDRFTDRPDPCSSWQAALADELDLIGAGGIDGVPAANAWQEDTGQPPPAGVLLRADPVGMAPDRDSAVLHPPEALQLSALEAEELVRDINAFIAEDFLTLHAAAPDRWYLAGDELPLRVGEPPEAHAFTRHDPGAPKPLTDAPVSDAERRLRGLGSELEMLLFAHPVNERRRAQGRPVVSGLYFWGAASEWMQRAGTAEDVPVDSHVTGDDAFTRCAAAAAGVVRSTVGLTGVERSGIVVDLSMRAAWLTGNMADLNEASDAFEQQTLRPALERFDAGELTTIVIRGDGGVRSVAQAPTPARGMRAVLVKLFARMTGSQPVARGHR